MNKFFRFVGQTSPAPMAIEIERAEGIYLYSPEGKQYIDLISGVSVSNVGHHNPRVVEAVCNQAKKYMHLMVYGEMIQTPQIQLAEKILSYLPDTIDNLYFVNSGSEAIDGAIKLAKRYTGKRELVSCRNAYHGSSHAALSIMGSETYKTAYRPLLPCCSMIEFNNIESLNVINENTAAVVVEPIQGEAGYVAGDVNFLKALRKRCTEMGAMLIFDEVQTGFGRSGSMFACLEFGVTPDIIALAKAMGGGMPIGGFAASREMMKTLTYNPILGHITTFGGHPVSAAAGVAAMEYLEENNLIETVAKKSKLFTSTLSKQKAIKKITGYGLMLSLHFESGAIRDRVVMAAAEKGIITEGFLFCEEAMRIAPPLTITEEQISECCNIILEAIEESLK